MDGTFKKVGDILAEDWGSVHWRHRYGNFLIGNNELKGFVKQETHFTKDSARTYFPI